MMVLMMMSHGKMSEYAGPARQVPCSLTCYRGKHLELNNSVLHISSYKYVHHNHNQILGIFMVTTHM